MTHIQHFIDEFKRIPSNTCLLCYKQETSENPIKRLCVFCTNCQTYNNDLHLEIINSISIKNYYEVIKNQYIKKFEGRCFKTKHSDDIVMFIELKEETTEDNKIEFKFSIKCIDQLNLKNNDIGKISYIGNILITPETFEKYYEMIHMTFKYIPYTRNIEFLYNNIVYIVIDEDDV